MSDCTHTTSVNGKCGHRAEVSGERLAAIEIEHRLAASEKRIAELEAENKRLQIATGDDIVQEHFKVMETAFTRLVDRVKHCKACPDCVKAAKEAAGFLYRIGGGDERL